MYYIILCVYVRATPTYRVYQLYDYFYACMTVNWYASV